MASALLLSACGGGGGGGAAAVTTYSISGAVAGAASVTVNLTGAASKSVTTDASGNYSFTGLANGSYTITPTLTGSTFNPASLAVAINGTALTAINFSTVVTLKSIAVTPLNPTTALNTRLQLTAIGTYSDNTTKNITAQVTWSSGSPAVVTVGAATGLVAPAAGATVGQTAVMTATSGTLTATTTITLAAIPMFSVATVADPLAKQQWGLLNTAQNGYADTVGVANTGGTLGTDINANPVYITYGYTGFGIIVAVVDSGLEITHEDLNTNVVPGGSWNFNNSTTDPTNTTATTGDHGTMVSGLIAMAMNGVGGIGVAPNAQLKGFNLLSSTQLWSDYVVSLGGSTASPNSSDVSIFNQSFGTSNTADFLVNTSVEAQYASGTSTLRGGKGALYVKSAGNGFVGDGLNFPATCGPSGNNIVGISCQNANFDPDNTLPYNIVMAALNAKGTRTSYSTAGSAIWASAPGGETGNNAAAITAAGFVAPAAGAVDLDPAMVTTDQSGCAKGESVSTAPTSFGPFSYFNWGGANLASINLNCNYTNGMNGTSSAAPMMSGVIALILEANPALTWRDVKHILAKTAVKVDALKLAVNVALTGGNYVAEQGWITNAAGFNFQNSYGFGAANVGAAVALAKGACAAGCGLGTFTNTVWVNSGALNLAIPDNSVTGVSTTLTAPKVGVSGIVEAVQIQVTTTNTLSGYTGDLGIELTSPSGTKSILKNIKDGFNGPNLAGMVLASNAFYGESSLGTSGTGIWTVKVVDGWIGGTQTLTNVKIRVYGH